MAKGDEKKQPGTEPAQPPAADQQAQTAAADATTIGALHEMIMVVGDQTAGLAQALAALAERVAALEVQPAAGESVPAVWSSTTEQPAIPQVEFDPAWLDGVVFTGARLKHDTGNIHEPFERKAKYDDVLSWRVTGDEVVIALSDGSKHQVKR